MVILSRRRSFTPVPARSIAGQACWRRNGKPADCSGDRAPIATVRIGADADRAGAARAGARRLATLARRLAEQCRVPPGRRAPSARRARTRAIPRAGARHRRSARRGSAGCRRREDRRRRRSSRPASRPMRPGAAAAPALAGYRASRHRPRSGSSPIRRAAGRPLQRVSAAPDEAERLQRAIGALDVRPSIANVRAPTLVIHCRGDAIVPVAMAAFSHQALPAPNSLASTATTIFRSPTSLLGAFSSHICVISWRADRPPGSARLAVAQPLRQSPVHRSLLPAAAGLGGKAGPASGTACSAKRQFERVCRLIFGDSHVFLIVDRRCIPHWRPASHARSDSGERSPCPY